MGDGVVMGQCAPKARKAHACELCGGTIAVGVRYEQWTFLYDGRPRTLRAHQSCERIRFAVVDADQWTEPPVQTWADDEYDGDLPAEPPHLDVVGAELADEWRAVWAAMRGDEVPRG